ncbi:frizzled-8-like [Bolinopsis microptera]|uniref:frizzled-8-like n=1 Tax=Bolinopsis microptera TaxID=2820187 RepID=UPI0030793AB6
MNVLLWCTIVASLYTTGSGYYSQPICNPTLGYCAKFFNMTKLPNKFNEDSYARVVKIQMHYADIATSECHPYVDLMICSTLFPACTGGYDITLPCYDFCEEVKTSCGPFIKKARIPWPFYFECLDLPRKKRGRFCIDEKFTLADLEKIKPPKPPVQQVEQEEEKKTDPVVEDRDLSISTPWSGIYTNDPEIKNWGLELVTTPVASRKDIREYEECSEPILFSVSEQNTTRVWIMAWSSIALSLSFVMLFVVTSHGKVNKPENIIVIICFCFLFQAAGFLLSVMVPQSPFKCSIVEKPGDPIYLKTNSPSPTCYLTFTATYFSGLAANLWWVTLNLLWFLMLGMNWSSDGSIFKVFRYLHLVIGGLAGGLTITILAVGAVEGDDLSGGCMAGGVHPENLATYDLTPNCVLLSIGGVVLLCGTYTLVKISRIDGYRLTHDIPVQRLKNTAIFSYGYLLISLIKTLCQFYELTYRSDWYKNCDPNIKTNYTSLELNNLTHTDNSTAGILDNNSSCGPDVRIFITKYTCYLLLPILVSCHLKNTVSILDIIKRLVPLAKGYTHRSGETKV